MQQLPCDIPLDIPDLTAAINKANLMAMEHNNQLNILNQIMPKSMWGTPKHMALFKEMGIDAVQITKQNSLYVPFTLHHFKGTEKEIALLDTGATESVVDKKTVQRLKLGTQMLDTPRPIYNVDGSPNKTGTIMQVCHLQVIQGNKKQRTPFYVTDLGTDRFILGYPWCQDFKLSIDWSNSLLNGPKVCMETLLYGKVQHVHQNLKESLRAKENDDLIFLVSVTNMMESPEDALAALEKSMEPGNDDDPLWSGGTTSEMECGWVEYIRRTHNTVETAHEYAKSHAKEEVILLECFKQHTALFSDEDAKKFPPSRPHDHKIKLTDKAPAQFNCKMYPMSAKEQAAEDKFLDENLEKGYIMPSDLPYGFSTFQVPKKDSDEMRYIIDYRPLNAVTK